LAFEKNRHARRVREIVAEGQGERGGAGFWPGRRGNRLPKNLDLGVETF
jgi:hypothetical protein